MNKTQTAIVFHLNGSCFVLFITNFVLAKGEWEHADLLFTETDRQRYSLVSLPTHKLLCPECEKFQDVEDLNNLKQIVQVIELECCSVSSVDVVASD